MKVLRYDPADEPNNAIVAYVDFYAESRGTYFCDCRLVRKKNGGFFIGYPSRRVERNGEYEYHPFFKFDPSVHDKFQSAALKAIDEFVKERGE